MSIATESSLYSYVGSSLGDLPLRRRYSIDTTTSVLSISGPSFRDSFSMSDSYSDTCLSRFCSDTDEPDSPLMNDPQLYESYLYPTKPQMSDWSEIMPIDVENDDFSATLGLTSGFSDNLSSSEYISNQYFSIPPQAELCGCSGAKCGSLMHALSSVPYQPNVRTNVTSFHDINFSSLVVPTTAPLPRREPNSEETNTRRTNSVPAVKPRKSRLKVVRIRAPTQFDLRQRGQEETPQPYSRHAPCFHQGL